MPSVRGAGHLLQRYATRTAMLDVTWSRSNARSEYVRFAAPSVERARSTTRHDRYGSLVARPGGMDGRRPRHGHSRPERRRRGRSPRLRVGARSQHGALGCGVRARRQNKGKAVDQVTGCSHTSEAPLEVPADPGMKRMMSCAEAVLLMSDQSNKLQTNRRIACATLSDLHVSLRSTSRAGLVAARLAAARSLAVSGSKITHAVDAGEGSSTR